MIQRARHIQTRVRQQDSGLPEIYGATCAAIMGINVAAHRNPVAAWCNAQLSKCSEAPRARRFEVALGFECSRNYAVIADALASQDRRQFRQAEVAQITFDRKLSHLLDKNSCIERTSHCVEPQLVQADQGWVYVEG